MSNMTRRKFIKKSVASSALFSTFTISGTKASGRVIGANDTIRVGVAGINNRGRAHLDAYTDIDKVDVAYLIDPDSRLFKSRSEMITSKGGKAPTCVQDPREALDDKNLDVISIATPNHWHSLLTIWACQAGKDVYVEKPLSHNISEGRSAVEAARKNQRVVQHGTQQRSSQTRADEIAAVHSGKYGKLLVSKGYCCKPRWSIGQKPNTKPPAELDFDVWLGPAAEQAYHENLVHYNWHWFWPTGNGDIGNQGVHEMDIARWAVQGATLPKRVWSLGGRFAYDDQGQTPNTQMAVFDYGDTQVVFEVRGLVGKQTKLPDVIGNEYYTTEGMIKEGTFHPLSGGSPEAISGPKIAIGSGGPFANFINVVRSREQQKLNADVLEGHYSSTLCHLANISYRLGEQVPFDRKAKTFGGDRLVYETSMNLQENLTTAGVPLEETTYQLGRTLEFDAESEQFVDSEEANRLLTRKYREPFVVPE